jgi:segregation and condensation protein B
MENLRIKRIVEAVLLAAGKPLSVEQLLNVFGDGETPEPEALRDALSALQEEYAERGIELIEVASGFRIQVAREMEPWVSRLTEEKPTRYSRALLETLALVAYRQPITRGDIEDIRGVSVSSSIMKTLQERDWVRIVGHRDVPGRPAMYGTTRQFLDYFNLKGLDDLPTLMELRDIDVINAELELAWPVEGQTVEKSESVEVEVTGEDGGDDDHPSARAVQVPVDVADNNGTLH